MEVGLIEVEVLLFAGVAEKLGQRIAKFELPLGANIAELSDAFCERYEELKTLVGVSRWAVDGEFVDPSFVINEQRQVALIPPVSGG